MKNQPLVSVILGNYNYGRFLYQSIDSVLNQTYKNFELIVVDDGSTDNSREVIESYHDRFVAIFQSNAGQEASLTAGIERSKGDIICFLDADDYFHPEKLSKVVQKFNEHPEWLQIGHCWISVNSEGKPVGRGASNILSKGDVSPLLLKWGKYASAISSGLSCRRSALENVMPFERGWGVDAYLNVAMPFYGKVGCINESLMFYRTHGKNLRAYSDDLSYLMQQREATAHFINRTAEKAGVDGRFDIERDIDYQSYKLMQNETISARGVFKIIVLSLHESIDIGRSPRDTLIRLLYRSICAGFPKRGKHILRLGFRRYVITLLKRQQLADSVRS